MRATPHENVSCGRMRTPRKHTYIILTSLNPTFYIVGLYRVDIIFLISARKHRLWVLVRTASPKNISEFLSENFQFWRWNFQYIWIGVFLVMSEGPDQSLVRTIRQDLQNHSRQRPHWVYADRQTDFWSCLSYVTKTPVAIARLIWAQSHWPRQLHSPYSEDLSFDFWKFIWASLIRNFEKIICGSLRMPNWPKWPRGELDISTVLSFVSVIFALNPAGTQRWYNVESTSMQRHDVV